MSFVCGPCLEGGNKPLAVKWCVSCQELLCIDCTRHHQALKLTKKHHLIEVKNAPAYPEQAQTKAQTRHLTCYQHPSRELHFFCRKHDILLCGDCIAVSHYTCSRDYGEVIPIEMASNGAKACPQYINCKTEVANVMQSFSSIIENKQKIENEFTCEVATARSKIADIKSDLIKYLDQVEEMTLTEVSKMEREVMDKLSAEKNIAVESLNEAEQLYNEIFSVDNAGSDKQAFILMQKVKAFREENEHKIKDMSYNMHAYSIKMNPIDPASIQEKITLQFGSIVMEPIPFNVKLTQDMKISVSCFQPEEPIKTDKYVNGMSITDDGHLVLSEMNVASSSRIYLFTDNGQQISQVKISGTPTDVAAIPGGSRAVVLVDDGKILFLDMTKAIHESNQVKMVKDCNCIAASFNKIFVGYRNEIVVMDSNGQYQQTIKVRRSPIQCLHAENNGDLYYAIGDSVYCRKEFGEEICMYKSQDLREVTGIALDIQGNVYISGRKSNNVHVLKQSNALAEIILKKEHGLEKPKGICINKLSNKLFIRFSEYKPIQVYRFQ